MSYAKSLIVSAVFAASVNAHMLMNKPTPFSGLINSPLDASGRNFPCQLQFSGGTKTTYVLGSTGNRLAFTGGATHGGGSCQISLTKDATPTASSVFKVIYSIEGGCPAWNATGNIGDDASAADPDTYMFDIPSKIDAGDYILSWTWFNKVGNREMYQNCAPVSLTGTGSDGFDSLPDMFVANIGNGCSTEADTDLLFPNPGTAVTQMNGATSAWGSPVGTCQTAAASAAASTATATAASAAAVATSKSSNSSGSFETMGSGSSSPSATAIAAASSSASSSSSSSSSGSISCSTNGGIVCVGTTQFGVCDNGSAVAQDLAAGTTCSNGVVSRKREIKFENLV